MAASGYVLDGDLLFGDFEVMETPGHTPGHVAYYYRPERALFAGDALAVIGGRVRFMARPVTLDLPAARTSMLKCLTKDIHAIYPGHREPLTTLVPDRVREATRRVTTGDWPLLG